MTINGNYSNNVLPVDNRSFCELVTHCELGALITRVAAAVVDFFVYIATKIYQAITCQCFSADQAIEPDLRTPLTKEEAPTEDVAKERRGLALSRLEQLKKNVSFECPLEISRFDLDETIAKYPVDQPTSKLLQWYDFAKLNSAGKENIENVLTKLATNDNPNDKSSKEKYKIVQNLVSKLHYILVSKRDRIDKLAGEEKTLARKAFNDEIQHIFTRLADADNDCIDQSLSQLEDIIIEIIASENPLGKNSTISFLQYHAAYALFRYRANLIKELIVKIPEFKAPEQAEHVADIEREVKRQLAQMCGMQGAILETGAAFTHLVGEQANMAVGVVAANFLDQYKPVEYIQNECRVLWGSTKALRNDLLQWATTHYDLEGSDETLAKAVVKSEDDLETMASVAAVELTVPGIQLFLEAAGIIVEKN